MKLSNILKLVVAVVASELAGIVGAFVTAPAIPTWYAGLAKPALNPPPWIFTPAWTLLYLLMGIAAFLIWRRGDSKMRPQARREVRAALGIFFLQLVLNSLWSIIFFGLRNPGWALIEIIILAAAIIWTMVAFYKISRPAIYLLVPYILWVSFATYLNFAIWMRN